MNAGRGPSIRRAIVAGLVFAVFLGVGGSQAPRGEIHEVVVLDNDSIRVVLLTYQPGADSDIHLNLGPEVTIVQNGELALYTPQGRLTLGAGAVHWLPGFTAHLDRNETKRPVKLWSFLLKRCD